MAQILTQLNFRKMAVAPHPSLTILQHLMSNSTSFLDHYMKLDSKFASSDALKKEFHHGVKEKVRGLGVDMDRHYKYWMYLQVNPELEPSPFLNRIDKVGKCMTKFRLGSHNLRIETGRWNRTPREDRLCAACGVIEDEQHIVYSCTQIQRNDLIDLPRPISSIWNYRGVNRLFKRIIDAEYLS